MSLPSFALLFCDRQFPIWFYLNKCVMSAISKFKSVSLIWNIGRLVYVLMSKVFSHWAFHLYLLVKSAAPFGGSGQPIGWKDLSLLISPSNPPLLANMGHN